jgi:FtsH-binding integral membrane protein
MPTNESKAQGVDSQDVKDAEHAKYARGILAEETKFRRDRRQQIFSWASSLLVAIIGGSTALASTKALPLTPMQKYGLYAAIAIVGLYSVIWICFHYSKEKKFRNKSKKYDTTLRLPLSLDSSWYLDLLNILALLGLTGAALFTVFSLLP